MRTRDLKPDFWTDERIVAISDAAKLMFQGLWGLADREGRLEDKPVTIGFKVRPWDPGATPALLEELHRAGLIIRYEVAGQRCIGIPGLTTHQRIHPKEMGSKLPDWNDKSASREKVELSAAGREKNENSVSQSGSSGSSEPSGPSGPSRVAPPKKKRDPKPPDPRHGPLVRELTEVFQRETGAKYPFGPIDAAAVTALLGKGLGPTITAAWTRALRHAEYPTVRTLSELVRHFAHFVGRDPTGPPAETVYIESHHDGSRP